MLHTARLLTWVLSIALPLGSHFHAAARDAIRFLLASHAQSLAPSNGAQLFAADRGAIQLLRSSLKTDWEHLGSCSSQSWARDSLRLREDRSVTRYCCSSLSRSLGQPAHAAAKESTIPAMSVYSRECLIRRTIVGAALVSPGIMVASAATASIA